MPEPTNKKLYDSVKKKADTMFLSKTGIYKSSWIVREYKRLGGKYKGSKPRSSGLKRWYNERWVDLNRPIKNSKGKVIGYKPCGRPDLSKKSAYPLCRPSVRVTRNTPKTHKELTKKSIQKALLQKRKVREKGNIQFGGDGVDDIAQALQMVKL
jgi:hypothetical protein